MHSICEDELTVVMGLIIDAEVGHWFWCWLLVLVIGVGNWYWCWYVHLELVLVVVY